MSARPLVVLVGTLLWFGCGTVGGTSEQSFQCNTWCDADTDHSSKIQVLSDTSTDAQFACLQQVTTVCPGNGVRKCTCP
jgi:hypothetical protein